MKKNKTLLGVALLIAVLMLGVGYALTSKPLSLTGTATAQPTDSNFVVEFESASADHASDVAEINQSDKTKATFTVTSLTSVGQKAVGTFKIKNKSNVGINAKITAGSLTETDDGDYFKVTTSLEDNENVAVNGEATYTVTVELIKAPVTDDVTGTFSVSFTAEALEA